MASTCSSLSFSPIQQPMKRSTTADPSHVLLRVRYLVPYHHPLLYSSTCVSNTLSTLGEILIYSYTEPLQLCSFPQCQATRALSGTSVPVLPAPSSAIIRGFGPESLGGIGDFGKRADDEAARLGVSPDEVADEVRYSPIIMS